MKNLSPSHPRGLRLSDCNAQTESPLFGRLSPEIRNHIYDLVFQPIVRLPDQEVVKALLKKGDVSVGVVRGSVDTALLRTCRLVYVEARFVPARNCEHAFVGTFSRWGNFLIARKHMHKVPLYQPIKFTHSLMDDETDAQIQKLALYDYKPCMYLDGCPFLNEMKPRKVFLVFPFSEFVLALPKSGGKGRWPRELEELNVRLDARPEDKEYLKRKDLVGTTVRKLKGGVLKLVDEGTLHTWRGLDLMGADVEWCSITYVWKA